MARCTDRRVCRSLLFLWTPFLFVLPQAARAEKGSRCPAAIHLFPASGSVVPRNMRLVLEGSGAERQRVLGLIGQDVLLKSEDDVVTAKVLRGWVSAKGPAAVVLRPRAWLKPNRVYRLLLDRVLPDFRLDGKSTDLPHWRISKLADEEAPDWLERPAPVEGSAEAEGNTAFWVKIRSALKDKSPSYVILTLALAEEANGPKQMYWVRVERGELMLKQDACDRGFLLEEGKRYLGTVEPYDVAGNPGRPVPLEFWAPRSQP